MADERRRTDDHIEETDDTLAPADSRGGQDELLVGLSGRADFAGDLVEEDDSIGDYEGQHESLEPDYEYRVSTAVSDEYGEYPAPGDEDMPLGYTTDEKVAAEEGLAYYPPMDPATVEASDRDEDRRLAAGFEASVRDAGYDTELQPEGVEGSDYDLAAEVVEAIQLTSTITGYRVRVHIEDGVAYLTGVVSTFEDIGLLASIVQNVPGIDDVDADDLDVSDENIEGMRVVISDQTEIDGDLEEEL